MPIYLGQLFFFNSSQGGGWSEGHFMEKDGFDDAMDTLRSLGDLRKALFTSNTHIRFIKVSDVDVLRDAIVDGDEDADGLGQGTYVADPVTQDNFPDVALLLRYTNNLGKWGIHYLRSIPENCVTQGVYTPAADWGTDLAAYIAFIQTNTLQRLKAVGGGYTYDIINFIAAERISRRKAGRPFGLLVGRGRRP